MAILDQFAADMPRVNPGESSPRVGEEPLETANSESRLFRPLTRPCRAILPLKATQANHVDHDMMAAAAPKRGGATVDSKPRHSTLALSPHLGPQWSTRPAGNARTELKNVAGPPESPGPAGPMHHSPSAAPYATQKDGTAVRPRRTGNRSLGRARTRVGPNDPMCDEGTVPHSQGTRNPGGGVNGRVISCLVNPEPG
jgi:hypothetical protein